jgi:hypothetical protein
MGRKAAGKTYKIRNSTGELAGLFSPLNSNSNQPKVNF